MRGSKDTDENILLSQSQWAIAQKRLDIIQKHLDDRVSIKALAASENIADRTIRRWIKRYEEMGITGLVSTAGRPAGSVASKTLQEMVEALALRTPPLSAASIYRYLKEHESTLKESIPSYRTVKRVIDSIDPSLITYAHQGRQAYKNQYDLVYRTEADGPNMIWQADHTVLDVLIQSKSGNRKPWLTIVLDDYSRAIAGYSISFDAPSAAQTALAFRHAIFDPIK